MPLGRDVDVVRRFPRPHGVDAVAGGLAPLACGRPGGRRPILSPFGSAFEVPIPTDVEPGKRYVGKSVFGFNQ